MYETGIYMQTYNMLVVAVFYIWCHCHLQFFKHWYNS